MGGRHRSAYLERVGSQRARYPSQTAAQARGRPEYVIQLTYPVHRIERCGAVGATGRSALDSLHEHDHAADLAASSLEGPTQHAAYDFAAGAVACLHQLLVRVRVTGHGRSK